MPLYRSITPGDDRTSRLVLVLALSVGVPGLVLSYFAFRSVQAEALAEKAHFQQRCESVAASLYTEAMNRFDVLQSDLGRAIDQSADLWTTDPARATDLLLERVDGVLGVLVLDESGNLVYPQNHARQRLAESRQSRFEEDLRSVMGAAYQRAEAEELGTGDVRRAAALYQAAIPTIPGYRGQLIARNGRARCLYKADRADEALRIYEHLAREGEGYRDINGFPLDLIAAYQVGQCHLALHRLDDAARTFGALLTRLTDDPWTYGGYAETVIADKTLGQLNDPALRAHLPEDARVDIAAARAAMSERKERQLLQSRVLALIPALAASRTEAGSRSGRFLYLRLRQGRDRVFMFARTSWRGPAGRRTLLIHLDEELLIEGITQRMAGIREANPELDVSLGEIGSGPSPLGAPTEGVVYQLEPWLPGKTVVVQPGDPTNVSKLLARGRRLRLLMIGAFTLLIALGLGVSYRAVRREIEIARMRTDFVSNVSHELRTPLATIRISAEMLSMGLVPEGDKQREYHDTILSESERLTRLIDNVLDFARIEQGRKKYRFRDGDVAELMQELERVTADFVSSAGFELRVKMERDLPRMRFDRDALVQALINLVTNAVQYTDGDDPERQVIELLAFRERDHLVIGVKDHGKGIDPKDHDRVFEKFQRGGDPLTRTTRGTGLGLAIVRHIANAHGGEVRLTSELGKGSTFSLVLPVDGRGA